MSERDASLAVVTGGGTGLGRALVLHLAAQGLPVIAVGRRREPLEAVRDEAPAGQVEILTGDVADPGERARIVEAIPHNGRLRYLVHNAAVLEPVAPLAEVDLDAWRYHFAVNLEAPLFLTQALLPQLAGGRVLHVSSGAAHRAIRGWGAYCTSKAALYMLYQVLHEELAGRGVAFGSVRPGVVDTPMQALIREQDPERFPDVETFRALKDRGELRSAEEAADFCAWLLTETGEAEFSAEEWDIGDPAATRRWKLARK